MLDENSDWLSFCSINKTVSLDRETGAINLWDKVKRVRSFLKGVFGDDSSQYEMVGGIRVSEWKFRIRKRIVAE